jgi:hypothetical protein
MYTGSLLLCYTLFHCATANNEAKAALYGIKFAQYKSWNYCDQHVSGLRFVMLNFGFRGPCQQNIDRPENGMVGSGLAFKIRMYPHYLGS